MSGKVRYVVDHISAGFANVPDWIEAHPGLAFLVALAAGFGWAAALR